MKIEVTQKHIDEGLPGECDKCPVALAIREASSIRGRIDVDSDAMVINGKRINTPSQVTEFIRLFDKLATVQPFTFELPI